MNQLMVECLYVMLIEKSKSYNKTVITRHIEHLRKLDDNAKLVLCGPFKDDCSDISGIVIFKAESYEEAEEICKSDPFVVEGYAMYKLTTLQVANKDNDYLL